MDKKMQKAIEKELVESFRVFYASLNQHLKLEEMTKGVEKYIEEIKDLMSITDDVDLKVKFVCTLPNGKEKHSVYQPIQLFVKNGITMPEDVETFKCVIRAEFIKNETKFTSTDERPFFKSETFVVEENAKSLIAKLYLDTAKTTEKPKFTVVKGERLTELSNNRIRIGETTIKEL